MRALLLVVAVATAAHAEPPHASLDAVPVRLRAPLSAAIPRGVRLTWFEEKGGVTTMRGRAKTFDEVSEFMRGLNNIVQSPKGLARVVERQRSGTLRVELIGPPKFVVEYAPCDVSFPFAGLQLDSTTTKGDVFEFQLSSRAP